MLVFVVALEQAHNLPLHREGNVERLARNGCLEGIAINRQSHRCIGNIPVVWRKRISLIEGGRHLMMNIIIKYT